MKLNSARNSSKQKSKSAGDIFTREQPGAARVLNRADVEEQWPMFKSLCKFFAKPASGPEGMPPVCAVLTSRSMLSAPSGSESGGRVLIVGLEAMFEPYLKKLAVQVPYMANWYGLDFDPEDTAAVGHWYLNLPDGSRYLFSLALEAIKQAFDGGQHAHVVFVAGSRVVVGGFEFGPAEIGRAQQLERTIKDKPEYEQATFEAGLAQAKIEGTSTPWYYGKYKLVTGAWRQHLNCMWFGVTSANDIETKPVF